MNFTIGQATLAEALNNLNRNSNEKFEAYQNIQIEAINENTIRLMSDNGVNRLEYTLEAREVSGEPIMVNARRFTDIVNKLKDIITFHDNIILSGRTKIKLDYIKGTLINPIDTAEIENSKLNLSQFKNVVKNRLYAVGKNNEHSVISDMFVNENDIVATNGNVLSLGTLKEPIYKSFLLSQSLAKEIIADFKDDETVNIAVENKKIIIWNDKLKIESNCKNGEYPKYKMLIPQVRDNLIKVNKNELINKLDIMSIVVEYTKPIIKLVFCKNELTVEHKEGKTVMNIENYPNEEPFEIYFNIHYLLSALKSTNSDNDVEIQLGEDDQRPVIIKGGNDLHLIMPVRV